MVPFTFTFYHQGPSTGNRPEPLGTYQTCVSQFASLEAGSPSLRSSDPSEFPPELRKISNSTILPSILTKVGVGWNLSLTD